MVRQLRAGQQMELAGMDWAALPDGFILLFVVIIYFALLLLSARTAESGTLRPGRNLARGLGYALSLSVLSTSWTYFGAVGLAIRGGWEFLPNSLGPIIALTLLFPIWRRIAHAARRENVNSVADFISSRYGKSRVLGALIASLAMLSAGALAAVSSLAGNLVLFGLVMLFLIVGSVRRVPVYEAFIEGAKEGFDVAKNLLPYLVAMLCAVGVLRASGALEGMLAAVRWMVEYAGWDTRFVDALPVALVKPFSGSAARALLIETMSTHGVDSFAAVLAATMQGSTETTFYVLAVYFGAVGIERARHAVACALIADLAGVLASIAVCYWFFG